MSMSDAYVYIRCDIDRCQCNVKIQLTATASSGWDERNVEDELEDMGWKVENGKHTCEECHDEDGEESNL